MGGFVCGGVAVRASGSTTRHTRKTLRANISIVARPWRHDAVIGRRRAAINQQRVASSIRAVSDS